MADSLRDVLRDMGRMRPRVDDYHPIYERVKKLVESGQYDASTPASPALRAHLTTACDYLNLLPFHPASYGDLALTEINRAIEELNDAPTAATDGIEVIDGEEFRKLPIGSIGIVCHPDGTPDTGAFLPIKRGGNGSDGVPGYLYRVLYRAPVKPLEVDEKITDSSRLAHAERGTVLAVALRAALRAYVRTANDEWELTGSNGVRSDRQIPLPATVVYVPKGESK